MRAEYRDLLPQFYTKFCYLTSLPVWKQQRCSLRRGKIKCEAFGLEGIFCGLRVGRMDIAYQRSWMRLPSVKLKIIFARI